jgi:hypothetical protein
MRLAVGIVALSYRQRFALLKPPKMVEQVVSTPPAAASAV